MNPYNPTQQITMIRQVSPVSTPTSMEDTPQIIPRGNLYEPFDQQSGKGPFLVKFNSSNQFINKDKGSNFTIESSLSKESLQKNERKYSFPQNRGSFPDYQANNIRTSEEINLKNQNVGQIMNKIGLKIKNQTDRFLQKSSTKLPSNGLQNIPKPQIKYVEVSPKSDKTENSKLQEVVSWIKGQMFKIEEKVKRNEIKIDRLQKNSKKIQQNLISSSDASINPQFQQINKILSLVQKAENRDDYKKSMKMIEQLRQNILEMHNQLASIKFQQQSMPKQTNQNRKDISYDELKNLKMQMDQETSQLSKKIQSVDDKYKSILKEYQQNSCPWTVSTKKFEGKMITLIYQETVSSLNNLTHNVNNDFNKNNLKPVQQTLGQYKENNVRTTILTSKTYYLDSEGYLLDKDKFYLLNSQNQQIKLSDKELELLKDNNLI